MDREKQALRQFLRNQARAQIPVTLSDIIAKVTAANKTKRKGLVIA